MLLDELLIIDEGGINPDLKGEKRKRKSQRKEKWDETSLPASDEMADDSNVNGGIKRVAQYPPIFR